MRSCIQTHDEINLFQDSKAEGTDKCYPIEIK